MTRYCTNPEAASEPQAYLDSPFTGSAMPAPKVSLHELEKLRRRAKELKDEVPFFRALLDAAVYAHAPLSDDSGRVRFIQFAHPETQALLLPFFSDAQQAHQASGGQRKVIAMMGRDFFEVTLGATLILNPNEDHVILYPEEAQGLLESGTVAPIDVEQLQEETTRGFRLPIHAPDWLEARLQDMFAQLPYVESAYLAEMIRPDDPENFVLILAAGVAPENAERAGRAVSTRIYTCCAGLQISVDLVTFDPAAGPPEWVLSLDVRPIYERSGNR